MDTRKSQENWEMKPIASRSGNSFLGRIGTQKVFVKVNASPLLPSLSTEGLTPKIQWIRKTDNGDTLTAQTWIEGTGIKSADMLDPQVPEIMRKLHQSRILRDSLSTFYRSVKRPANVLYDMMSADDSQLVHNMFLSQLAEKMLTNVPKLNNFNIMVVHGDVRLSNWLRDKETGRIYLINWDTVSLGDPFYDLGYLVSHFVPYTLWASWLSQAGYKMSDISVIAKLRWYGQLSFLQQADEAMRNGDTVRVNQEIQGLRLFRNQF